MDLVKPGDKFDKPGEVWLRISAFLDGKSRATQVTYLGIIREWCEYLGAEAGSSQAARLFLEASNLHAIAYKRWLEGRPGQRPRYTSTSEASKSISTERRSAERRDGLQAGLSNATIAKKFSALRRIYKLLLNANLLSGSNPFDTDAIPTPSAKSGQRRPTEMVDFQVVNTIVNLPDTTNRKGVRDKALLSILFGGGLRRSELVNLRIGDVRETPSGTLFLRLRSTKAKTDADQALPEWAAENVVALLDQRLSDKAQKGDHLIISYRGRGGATPTNNPISPSGVYNVFRHYCKLAGVENVVSPHSARATAITKLLADGIGHREVQEFSRHSSVQMVEVYDKRRIGVDENPATKLEYE